MSRLESNYQTPVTNSGDSPSAALGGKSFENTLAFAAEASAVPVDLKTYFPPKHSKQSNEQWQRDWEMTGLYFGTDKLPEEIGKTYELTGERVRQIVRGNLSKLYEASSEDIRARYPIETLRFGKPISNASRSLARGGKSLQVQRLKDQGKSVREIKAELGLTGHQLSVVRIVLRRWDENLPYEREACSLEYRQNLERLKTDTPSFEEAQKILDSVTKTVYASRVGGDKALFFPIRKLAQEAGLIVSNREIANIAEILKKEQIPTGEVESSRGKQGVLRYHFITISDKDRAKQVLLHHPDLVLLSANPVRVLGKDTQDLPTASRLKNSGAYSAVQTLFKEIGYPRLYPTFKQLEADIIDLNCPVSIFVYRSRSLGSKYSRYYYEISMKEELKAYLLKRTSELKKRSG